MVKMSTQKRTQNELTGVLPRPYPRVQRPERVAPPRCGPWRGPLETASRITCAAGRAGGERVRCDSENAGALTLGLMEAPLEAPGAARKWLVTRARRGDGHADGDTNRQAGPANRASGPGRHCHCCWFLLLLWCVVVLLLVVVAYCGHEVPEVYNSLPWIRP